MTAPPDLSDLRASEYARLDRHRHVYLDYTGAGLYAESQLREHVALLTDSVLGNPHSLNPTSATTTDLIESTRHAVLSYFQASPAEYEAIFTLNASNALKLVGEAYPFAPGGQYLLTYDNHNSVNGIREFAREKGATFRYVPISDPELRIDAEALSSALKTARPGSHNLFAYPAQSNFSGVQHSLEWIKASQERGWDVLLDAAAFVPTNQLDLSAVHPDFVVLSFYKMFGYPTGVGCLLARREAAAKLHRPWFAGGTVLIASARGALQGSRGFVLNDSEAAFEDGTVNFLDIPAVDIGLRFIERIGMDTIHNHVRALTGELLRDLQSLHHSNGVPLVHVYGPASNEARGATVTINFFDSHGTLIHPREIERVAATMKISLRTGCHCNPGAGETALHVGEAMAGLFKSSEEMARDRFHLVADALKEGAVRASLGIASNRADVAAFVGFAERFLDRSPSPIDRDPDSSVKATSPSALPPA